MAELLVVLALISILGSIALPAILAWLPNMRLHAAGRDLYGNIQNARMTAIRSNEPRVIAFNPGNNSYTLYSGPGADRNWKTLGDNTVAATISLAGIGSGVKFGHGSISGSNSATTPPGSFPPNHVSYNDSSYSTNTVLWFNPRGTGNAGYVYMQNDKGSVIAVGTQSSGVVMMKRWRGSDWK